jgi:hypothetical protein
MPALSPSAAPESAVQRLQKELLSMQPDERRKFLQEHLEDDLFIQIFKGFDDLGLINEIRGLQPDNSQDVALSESAEKYLQALSDFKSLQQAEPVEHSDPELKAITEAIQNVVAEQQQSRTMFAALNEQQQKMAEALVKQEEQLQNLPAGEGGGLNFAASLTSAEKGVAGRAEY